MGSTTRQHRSRGPCHQPRETTPVQDRRSHTGCAVSTTDEQSGPASFSRGSSVRVTHRRCARRRDASGKLGRRDSARPATAGSRATGHVPRHRLRTPRRDFAMVGRPPRPGVCHSVLSHGRALTAVCSSLPPTTCCGGTRGCCRRAPNAESSGSDGTNANEPSETRSSGGGRCSGWTVTRSG